MFKDLSGVTSSMLLASIVILLLCCFIIVTVLFFYYKRKKHHHQQVLLQSEFEKTLLHTQLEIQERTFTTISQEIHDNIGQMLAIAKLNLNSLSREIPKKDEEKIETVRELLIKTVQDLRDLSRTLNTDVISAQGFIKAVEGELALINRTGMIASHFVLTGDPFRIDDRSEVILFRIVQEALHNIIKHANASAIDVAAHYQADDLQITIVDNGTGFDQKDFSGTGSGLRNMQSRCLIIGGTFNIQSAPGKGTKITICFPRLVGDK